MISQWVCTQANVLTLTATCADYCTYINGIPYCECEFQCLSRATKAADLDRISTYSEGMRWSHQADFIEVLVLCCKSIEGQVII